MGSKLNYCFQLTANQSIDNYWIRANPPFGNVGFEGGINSAILRYDTAAPIEPTTSQQTTQNLLNEVDLHPLTAKATVRDNVFFGWIYRSG